MLKKLLVLVLVATLAGLALVPVAGAQGDPPEGYLSAQGDGIAGLAGRGVVDLTGNGTLWIKDNAGDAVIEVTGAGQKKEFEDGWIQYAGFNGSAHVEGSRIGLVVAGVDINLEAQGRGAARLRGHGSYQSGSGDGEWSLYGARQLIRLSDTAVP